MNAKKLGLVEEKELIRVIIIEDNDADNLLYTRYLERSQTINFDIVSFRNIDEFYSKFTQEEVEEPYIVLISADLKNTSIGNNLKIIQECLPNEPIIIAREFIDEHIAQELLEFNIYGYIEKNEFQEITFLNTFIACNNFYTRLRNAVSRANYDALTNLANRALLEDRVQHAISLCSRSNKIMAVLMIDLDDFKLINDNYGHDFGDIFLKNISNRLKDSVRITDTVARLGGDEFAILLEGIDYPEKAGQVAKKILESISEPMSIKGKTVVPSLSIGLSLLSHEINSRFSYDWLIQSADKALYQAKNNGKNTYSIFSDENDDEMLRVLDLEDQITKALKNEDFILYYQPIFNTNSHQVSGCEALLRWKKPSGEILGPNQFMETVERLGLAKELGDIVIKKCLTQYTDWIAQGMEHFSMHINISPAQFISDGFFKSFKGLMDKYEIPANYITLELTEQQFFKNTINVEREFMKLNWYGIKIAIDDFGTGYGSYDYIRRFKIDTIKLDRSFITEMFNNPLDMAIVQSITKFAHELKINIVAEGVETEKQWNYLTSIDINQIQGFYKGRPMPANDFYRTFIGNAFVSDRKMSRIQPVKGRIYY